MPKIRLSAAMILSLLASGCVSGASTDALCGPPLATAIADHAAALAEDGGPRSVLTGDYAIRLYDAGCGRS